MNEAELMAAAAALRRARSLEEAALRRIGQLVRQAGAAANVSRAAELTGVPRSTIIRRRDAATDA